MKLRIKLLLEMTSLGRLLLLEVGGNLHVEDITEEAQLTYLPGDGIGPVLSRLARSKIVACDFN